MFPIVLATLAAQTSAIDPQQPWPDVRPAATIATPDWSDYRIYPAAARDKGEEGKVVPEILVGVDGKPVACRITVSSGFAELDAGTCDLMMKMRFDPPRDAFGKPVESHYVRPIAWVLSDQRPFASSRLGARLSITDGKFRSCNVVGGEGAYVAAWTGLACAVFIDMKYTFMTPNLRAADVDVEVRLNTGDGAIFLNKPWPAGNPVAVQKIAFTVNGQGDPSECKPLESRGFGARGMSNLSPCGGLLSSLWFEDPVKGAPLRAGVIETRFYMTDPNAS